jgi:colanic acid/amylovoran biosynthesis glycosyltransferase
MSRLLALDPGKAVAAIYRGPLFNASETFIQAQAASLTRYRPLLVGRERKGNVRRELAGHILIRPTVAQLRGFAPHLIHAHFATDGLAALGLAAKLDIPLVTTLHGYDVALSPMRMLTSGHWSWMRYALLRRRLMTRGGLFLAVSEAIRRRALSQGFPPERTLTHHIGVDLESFRPGATPDPGLIVHVGRLVAKKGTEVLLDALAAARRSFPAAQLVVIGDGPLRAALERKTESLGLGSAVRFIGMRSPDEILGWMQRAWLIAAPSVTAADGDSEGLPTVLAEAAACGLPAVATHHSGIPEAVLDGRTGLLVAERDVHALAAALVAMLSDAEMRRRMGAAARGLAEAEFDLTKQTAVLEAHYDRLVASSRP